MQHVSISLAAILLAIPVSSATTDSDDWLRFRRQFPFHIQTLAVSQPHRDGTRTLILSEPPPAVTLEGLRLLDPALAHAAVREHAVGIDGCVRDVVVVIPPLDSHDFDALADRLHLHLFGSTYKAWTLEFDAPVSRGRLPGLNLHVSATDLRNWVIRDRERFATAAGSSPATIQQLLSAGRSGVFYGVKPGLVAWIVDRKRDLAETRRQIRRFSVDTDLILGAIPSATHVAILARERQTPVELLPPLRSETILLLAAVDTGELHQSYERGNFLAGKLKDDNDWAPIYLSDALIDTEYGSLLNITDQLLKSWSSGGKTWYRGFTYPEPPNYPFGGQPLLRVFKSREVTFNWNTKGAGYVVQGADLELMALNRTGSLPLTYIPEGASAEQLRLVNRYEEEGYEFFSGRSDPNLVRVVQYAALYQVFRAFNIHSQEPSLHQRAHPETAALISAARKSLARFAETEDRVLELLVTLIASREKLDGILSSVQALRAKLRNYAKDNLDSDYAILARVLANPRSTPPTPRLLGFDDREWTARKMAHEFRGGIAAEVVNLMFVDPDGAKDAFAAAASRKATTWIKTPSYVISTSFEPKSVHGGHNLDSKVSYFRTSPGVPRGQVRFGQDATGRRFVTVNEFDAPAIPSLLRANAVGRDPAPVLKQQLDRILETAKPSLLSREQALRLSEPVLGPPPAFRRGFTAAHLDSSRAARSGWEFAPDSAGTADRVAAGAPPRPPAGPESRTISVERNSDRSYTIRFAGDGETVVARSHTSAIDAVATRILDSKVPAGRWRVEFAGLEKEETTHFMRTTEVQFKKAERVELAGFSRGGPAETGTAERALKSAYDPAHARILGSKVEILDRGLAGERHVLDMNIELPARAGAPRPPLLVRIRILFSKLVSEGVMENVRAIVAKALTRPETLRQGVPQPRLTEEIIHSIRQDLRNMKVRGYDTGDVRIEMSGDWGDYFVARLLEIEDAGLRPSD